MVEIPFEQYADTIQYGPDTTSTIQIVLYVLYNAIFFVTTYDKQIRYGPDTSEKIDANGDRETSTSRDLERHQQYKLHTVRDNHKWQTPD